jgi:hypothetical protein
MPQMPPRKRSGRRPVRLALLGASGVALLCVIGIAAAGSGRVARLWEGGTATPVPVSEGKTRIGVNLYGLATFNRQQVFSNLISQSEWFSSLGDGWRVFPAEQMDARGWIRFLAPGETAPRPLILPPAPFRPSEVKCVFEGKGALEAGGIASVRTRGERMVTLDLKPTGGDEDGAWIELTETDPSDPLRAIDCREVDRPAGERFHPGFIDFVKGFKFVRFVDWQRTNDNFPARWRERTLPETASQVGPGGASVEDMVDLANLAKVDPWFLMPYQADESYIRAFAQLVHERLDPARTVYVELGNEVWNDNFDAAQQAQREGMGLHLGSGDPTQAQMIRYAQKTRVAMQVWTQVFADRPARLVRIAASQNANPVLAEMILGDADTAHWVDALATAPYIWLDIESYTVRDIDRLYGQIPGAIANAWTFAEQNRAVATRYGKRFIAYEGGQHLVTDDLDLARAIQRDRRMEGAYRQYLAEWDRRFGSDLALYASTAPIAGYGSWGLQEYAGQPIEQAPKLRAVRQFLGERR